MATNFSIDSDVNIDLDGVKLAITEGSEEARQTIAEEGVGMVRSRLGRVLKHPTGRYSASVIAEKKSNFWVINGMRKIYGGWLEGVSRRNAQTRFKGYATFRIIGQELQDKAAPMAEREIERRMPS